MCDRVEPWAYGTVVTISQAPLLWDYNAVRLERGRDDLTAGELVAEADRLQAGLEHRRIEVWDEATGRALRAELAALGWDTVRLLWMLHQGPLPDVAAAVVEVTREDVLPLREEWLRADGLPLDFLPQAAAVASALGTRYLAVLEGARPVGYATLVGAGTTVEIENVYVTPDERARGLGATLTGTAVRKARERGAAEVWIVADDEDRPKELYARLGFRAVCRVHEFTRRAA